MSDFKPVITTSQYLSNVSKLDGQLVAVYDTLDLYIDRQINQNTVQRIKYSDVICDTYNNITGLLSTLPNKIYFATDTHQLLQRYNNEWVVLNGGSETSVVTNSDSQVSINLANNTIYNLTNANISSIVLTDTNSIDYCTICFTAGTSTTFSPPVGSRCIGYDCSGGIFTPISGKEYQIAVDKLGNQLTFYVLRMDLNAAS